MAVIKSNAFNFREVVDRYLTLYGVECMEATADAIKEVSKETVKKLRQESAAQFGKGDYSRGWTRKLNQGRTHCDAVVYGKKPTAQLAHLLEKGHDVKNEPGGKVIGRAPAHPHIESVNQWAQDEAVDRIIYKLERL